MKKILTILTVFIMALSLTACGSDDSSSDGKTTTGASQGNSSGGNALGDISADNWDKVVAENFGLELSLPDGWSIESAKSPNGVNNITIFFKVGGSETYKTFGEKIFEELKKDADGDITKYGDKTKVYKSFSDAVTFDTIASIGAKISGEGDKSLSVNYYDNGATVEMSILRLGIWN